MRPAAVAPEVAWLASYERLLHARGVRRVPRIEPAELPADIRIHRNVGMDWSFCTHVVSAPGDALGTTGVGPCYAIGAVGVNAQGATVLGLGHYSFTFNREPPEILQEVLRGMAQAGVTDPRLYIAGGIVCLFADAHGRTDPDSPSSVRVGAEFIKAAGGRITAAIGLSETGPDEEPPQGYRRAAGLGRPESVSVVLAAHGMCYCNESAQGYQLDSMPAPEEELSSDEESDDEWTEEASSDRPQLESLGVASRDLVRLEGYLDLIRMHLRRET